MPTARVSSDEDASENLELHPGVILVSPHGLIRILRSRTAGDDGWNCSDGAAIDDAVADDRREWMPYTPEQLAADLRLAREITEVSGHRALSGGIATWDACSGRPCVLPKLAKIVR